jgi:hypothetical protein
MSSLVYAAQAMVFLEYVVLPFFIFKVIAMAHKATVRNHHTNKVHMPGSRHTPRKFQLEKVIRRWPISTGLQSDDHGAE